MELEKRQQENMKRALALQQRKKEREAANTAIKAAIMSNIFCAPCSNLFREQRIQKDKEQPISEQHFAPLLISRSV